MADDNTPDPLMAELDRRLAAFDAEDGAQPEAPAPASTVASEAKATAEGSDTPKTDKTDEQAETPTDPLTEAEAKQDAEDNPGKTQEKQSRYEKRREEIQKQLAEAKAERENAQKERDQLKAEREEWERQRQAAEASKKQYTPEEYEAWAQNQAKQADSLEEAGEFDKATELRGLANAARREAKRLRENPPAASEQQARQDVEFEKATKEWAGKAFQDFPEIKKGGALNGELQEFIKTEPDVMAHPKGFYYAAELVANRKSALRVPGLEKQVAELQTKIKELEALTSPDTSGNGSVARIGNIKSFEDMDVDEMRAALRREAALG